MANYAWYNRPPDGNESPSLPVLRPKPAGGAIEGIILSDDIVGVMLHWVGRSVPHRNADPTCPNCDTRTVPPIHCDKHQCPGCAADRPMRWEGYVVVWQPKTGVTAIVAVTPGTCLAFETYRQQHGTLRGAHAKVMRNGFKATAPITVILKRSDTPPAQLPKAPHLPPILAKIWGVVDSRAEQAEIDEADYAAVAELNRRRAQQPTDRDRQAAMTEGELETAIAARREAAPASPPAKKRRPK